MAERTCNFCPDTFTDEDKYQSHLRFTHHYCETCEKRFENGAALFFHLYSIDHENGEKKTEEIDSEDSCDEDCADDCPNQRTQTTTGYESGSEITDREDDRDVEVDSESDSDLEDYNDANWFIDLNEYPASTSNVHT